MGVDLELVAGQRVSGPDAGDPLALSEKSGRLYVVGGFRPRVDGGFQNTEGEARRAVHLRVVEGYAAGQPSPVDARKFLYGLFFAKELAPGYLLIGVALTSVAIEDHSIVCGEPRGDYFLTLHAVSVRRHEEGQGVHLMWGDAHQGISLTARGANATDISRLHIAEAAVDYL